MDVYAIKCKSVNCYLIKAAGGYLLFDAGWINEYRSFKDSVKAINISPKEIKWFIVSHFHIDHAGLAGILLNNGKQFVVFENQNKDIDKMENFIVIKNYAYTKINKEKILYKKLNESRDWLKTIGIAGEVIQTYGHGEHNIALLLDDGKAFIGDLPVIYKYDESTKKDWDKITAIGAKYIYPAHSESIEINQIKTAW